MTVLECWFSGWMQAAAQEGDTAPPDLDEVVNLHFVAFVCRGGRLWELDGRKSFPVDHGPSNADTLLQVRSGGKGLNPKTLNVKH